MVAEQSPPTRPRYPDLPDPVKDILGSIGSLFGGLGGADISLNNILSTIDRLEAVKDEPGEKEVQWYLEP